MTDFELLDKKIEDSGMPITTICKRAGIKKETYYNRRKGIGFFTAPEIIGLSETLKLSNKERDKIFLATELADSQH